MEMAWVALTVGLWAELLDSSLGGEMVDMWAALMGIEKVDKTVVLKVCPKVATKGF
eukprot:CAMPEP_0170127016 /NCGR_PEP_ID=MMETSP0020_2-20130122/20139_1 /TAXON_ID=98059 /ORGANISM="Dinobryon sp., Strain UTEXLB2267" /LENGTH=55 /DNA_ID=CAMNT_0010360295 /DNA_START=626 /DNA_END=793 /DNA_ORIENTATION=-